MISPIEVQVAEMVLQVISGSIATYILFSDLMSALVLVGVEYYS